MRGPSEGLRENPALGRGGRGKGATPRPMAGPRGQDCHAAPPPGRQEASPGDQRAPPTPPPPSHTGPRAGGGAAPPPPPPPPSQPRAHPCHPPRVPPEGERCCAVRDRHPPLSCTRATQPHPRSPFPGFAPLPHRHIPRALVAVPMCEGTSSGLRLDAGDAACGGP